MASVAERFVAEWIDEHVGNGWRWKGEPEHLEFLAQYLVQKLETAAWEFGLTPDELLDAVDGAPTNTSCSRS
jgi:hypothetical protein